MTAWIYRGRTPTPVVTSDRGSVVVTHGSRFEAHAHQVSHLVRSGLVVEARPQRSAATTTEQEAPEASQETATKATKSEETALVEQTDGASGGTDVVEESTADSVSAEPEAEAVPTEGDSQSAVERSSKPSRRRRR